MKWFLPTLSSPRLLAWRWLRCCCFWCAYRRKHASLRFRAGEPSYIGNRENQIYGQVWSLKNSELSFWIIDLYPLFLIDYNQFSLFPQSQPNYKSPIFITHSVWLEGEPKYKLISKPNDWA